MSHSAAQSSVGSHTIYEDGDQRNAPRSEAQHVPYKEGTKGSHKNLDSKDERSIANKLASQERKPDSHHHHHNEYDHEAELSKQDPTKPVRLPLNYVSFGQLLI
jgi:hypothetical protein